MTNSGIFRRLRLALFFIGALAAAVSAQWATPSTSGSNGAPVTNNGQPVNDFANVIDDAAEAQLNQKLKDFMTRTNPPVAISVVTVRTTGGRDPFEYSLAIARGWKIGSDRDDNPSALLFVAVDDRKYQTQISRDLEDELTDGLAGQLQRQYLVPAFKAGDYTKGINDTIDAYIKRIDEKQAAENPSGTGPTSTVPTERKSTPAPAGSVTNTLIRGVCCLIVIIILLAIILGRSKGGRGGGGGYRGGGGGSALPWIIGSVLANSSSGSSGSSWGSSDSSWGGSSGGGGSDWGGFGGGGDFGGGGSGGSW